MQGGREEKESKERGRNRIGEREKVEEEGRKAGREIGGWEVQTK